MIRRLLRLHRLYSRTKDPRIENGATWVPSDAGRAERHERAIQFFKRRGARPLDRGALRLRRAHAAYAA